MSNWNVVRGRYGSGAGETDQISIDPVSNAIVTTTLDHKEMHEGHFFFIKTYLDVTGDGTKNYFMFRTPNTSTRIHARVRLAASSEFTVSIYETPTLSADGTPFPGKNVDRDSIVTPELDSFAAPTVTATGDLLWSTKIGDGKEGGVIPSMGYEIIARTNEVYLFELEHKDSGTNWIDIDFFWYEHQPQH